MRKITWLRTLIIFVVSLGLLGGAGGTSINAVAATVTPFGAQRFTHDHATYVITTKSAYYRNVWQDAIRAWNKTGAFKFEPGTKRNAQIDLDTDSRRQSATMGDNVGVTQFWAEHNDLIAVVSTLNPELMSAFGYSHADKEHVAEHELGHAMGLNHNPSKDSVMYYRDRSVGIQKVDVLGVEERYHTPAGESD